MLALQFFLARGVRSIAKQSGQNMQNPYALFAPSAVCLAFMIEVGTLDLGREFTWFGKLSQQQSAWVRYCVFTVAALPVIAAFVYCKRGSPRSR
jgi:hypothetical protein